MVAVVISGSSYAFTHDPEASAALLSATKGTQYLAQTPPDVIDLTVVTALRKLRLRPVRPAARWLNGKVGRQFGR